MKTIDVRIAWDKPDEQHWLNADNIKTALEAHCYTNFTVTELPPQVEERSCENCKDKETSAESLPCLTCMRAFHGHYSHCKLSGNFDNWQPAAPVPPPVEKEMICPKAKSCASSKICSHAKPHDVSFACNMTNITCPVCAPVAPAELGSIETTDERTGTTCHRHIEVGRRG